MTGAPRNPSARVAVDAASRIEFLEQELRLRETEIALLRETADAVVSELNLERLLKLVTERAQVLIDAETVLLPILDYECSQYTYRAGCGKNAEEIVGESLPLDFGVCGWVWRHKRAWWLGVLDELDPDERNKWEREAHSVILVPLIGKHHFLGGLAGINKKGADRFSRRDLDLLTMFAAQVSIAIENANSYEALDNARQEAESYRSTLEALNTQLADANKELEQLALYDPLTKLPNRSLVQDRLRQEIFAAERERTMLSIIMLDLDHFKEVNDTLGHTIGDRLLRELGARLSRKLRKSDTVGRLGGDEFAIVLPGADEERAVAVARELLSELEPPFDLGLGSISMAASLGIATYPAHGRDADTLLKHADVAMYVAKRAKQGYAVYHPEKDRHSPARLVRLGELRAAIQNAALTLYYQPQLDLRTRRIVGVEALARWPQAQGATIMPDEFIPDMEQMGLIRSFTLWALETALDQYARWRAEGFDLTMSVNLSMHNLRDPRFTAEVGALLDRWKPAPNTLILEITESAVMTDSQYTLEILEELSRDGVQFSIDDFGTGYSSLSHLKRLPVHELKIDKSFVLDMIRDPDDAVIVRSTIDLAHNLGLRVIAEGAENQQTVDMLAELDCDLLQGYFIARPLPPADLTRILLARG